MDIHQYEELTGITVPASQEAYVTAQIRRTQRVLEGLLGFSLDPDNITDNEYVESGKMPTDCPCPDDDADLLPADAVIFAYRLFPYNEKDKFLSIDPATAIHKVKLVKDNVTYRTLEPEQYRGQVKKGLIKFLEQIKCFCSFSCHCSCAQMQLAVDATWVWTVDQIPEELLDIWADMVTTYSDQKYDIKSETLGPHSYTRFDNLYPEDIPSNIAIIKKYAGPNGTIQRTITL